MSMEFQSAEAPPVDAPIDAPAPSEPSSEVPSSSFDKSFETAYNAAEGREANGRFASRPSNDDPQVPGYRRAPEFKPESAPSEVHADDSETGEQHPVQRTPRLSNVNAYKLKRPQSYQRRV